MNPETVKHPGLKYVAPLAESIGWTEKQTIDALNSMSESGDRAGTSLRMIIFTLLSNTAPLTPILNKYGILYIQVDPMNNTLNDIIRVFAKDNVSSRDIVYIFGDSGIDFIDMVYAYKMENINNEHII
jgi:hypothetical protein